MRVDLSGAGKRSAYVQFGSSYMNDVFSVKPLMPPRVHRSEGEYKRDLASHWDGEICCYVSAVMYLSLHNYKSTMLIRDLMYDWHFFKLGSEDSIMGLPRASPV